jgi:hypothetical protein
MKIESVKFVLANAIMIIGLVGNDAFDLDQTSGLNKIAGGVKSYLDRASLTAELQNVHDQKLVCIKTNGFNPEGFEYCCGHSYEKISSSFLNRYKIIEMEFERLVVTSIRAACREDQDPCNELILTTEQLLPQNRNVMSEVAAKADEIKRLDSVDRNDIEEFVNVFQDKYDWLIKARAMIASFLFDTVKDIKTTIRESQVAEGFDYESFDPTRVLDLIGVIEESEFNSDEFGKNSDATIYEEADSPIGLDLPTIMESSDKTHTLAVTIDNSSSQEFSMDSGLNSRQRPSQKSKSQFQRPSDGKPLSLEDKLKMVESEVDAITYPLIQPKSQTTKPRSQTFNDGLLSEVGPRNQIYYYISKSLVDKDKLDMTKLPSDLLKEIKNKLIIDS